MGDKEILRGISGEYRRKGIGGEKGPLIGVYINIYTEIEEKMSLLQITNEP